MYKKPKYQNTSIQNNECYEGETIEAKIRRIVNNNEPISDGAPLVYTDRAEGIQAAYDIRTDRFEIAVDAMDKVTASRLAKREMNIQERTYDTLNDEQKSKFHEKFPNSKIQPIKNKGEA